MQEALLERVTYLINTQEEEQLTLAAELLEEHLKSHPTNTEIWLCLYMVRIIKLFDIDKAAECCKKILAYDPTICTPCWV